MNQSVDNNPDPGKQGDGTGDGDQDTNAIIKSLQGELAAMKTGMLTEREKRQKFEVELAEVKGFQAAGRTKPDKREFTRAELEDHVMNGKISEAERDRILDDQAARKIQRTVEETVTTTVQTQERLRDTLKTIDRYTGVVPDLLKEGSAQRDRVRKEFEALLDMGDDPTSKVTELKALRSVYGPIDDLEAGKSRAPNRETHQEGGSGQGGDDSSRSGTKDGPPSGLSSREKAYYQDRIVKGIYPDWAAVTKELKHANPSVRARRA